MLCIHLVIIYYILSIRTTSDKVRMRQMFHVKTWRRCNAHYVYSFAKKEKGSEIDASPQIPISTGVQSLEHSRLPWSVPIDRSRLPRLAIMAVQVQSIVLMYSYATRGLAFLVRCATISRQLGQGKQRSGGSPLFMLNICLVNHRSSIPRNA